MKRAFLAAIHVTARQFGKLSALGNKVITNLAANAATFPAPDPAIAQLQAVSNTFATQIGQAKTGDHQKVQLRNATAVKFLGMLQTERNYINKIAQGDKSIILLSGFDASAEPTPLGIPDATAIQKITDGPIPLSAKILLARITNPLMANKPKFTYIVQSSTTPLNPDSFKTVLITQNSRNLVIPNMVRLQEIFFRVAAMNSHGQGEWSPPVVFVAR